MLFIIYIYIIIIFLNSLKNIIINIFIYLLFIYSNGACHHVVLPEGVKGQGSPMQPGKTAQQQGQQRSSPRIDQGQQGQQGQGHIRLIPTVKHSRSLSKPSMGQKKQVPRLSPSSATAVPGQRSPATVSPRFAQKRAPGTPKTQANAPTLSPPLVTIAKPDAQKQSAEPASAANTALEKSEPTISTAT